MEWGAGTPLDEEMALTNIIISNRGTCRQVIV